MNMMKQFKSYAIALFLLNSFLGFSQDSIVFVNGSKAFAKVMEISSSSIKYAENGTGGIEMKEKNKSEVFYIVYSNGTKETLTIPVAKKEKMEQVYYSQEEVKRKVVYGKNIIAVNVFHFLFTSFSGSYERTFDDGKLGLKIPIEFGLGGKPNMYDYRTGRESYAYLENRNYGVGLELNAYPYASTRSTFYVGISTLMGSFDYYASQYNGYPYGGLVKHEGKLYSGMLHLGGNIGLSDNLMIGMKMAAGFKQEETIFEDYTRPRFMLDLNLAYRF